MKFFVVACLVASAVAVPIEDTADVKAAKAEFMMAYSAAEKGEHAALAPKAQMPYYIEDTDDVVAAKKDFMMAYKAAEMGEHAALAPKQEVAYAHPFYNSHAATYAHYPYYYNNMHYNYMPAAAWNYGYYNAAPYTTYQHYNMAPYYYQPSTYYHHNVVPAVVKPVEEKVMEE